jgi:DNA-binding response OmpR family regulator
MITTENDDVERKKAAEAGIDAYMIKPVSAESVNTTIKQLLNIK